MKNKFIQPSKDLMFKNLFGIEENIEFTIDMLKKLLHYNNNCFKDAKVINSIKLNKETIKNKHFEMDVLLKLKNGDLINIEIQSEYDKEAEMKSILYATGNFYKSIKSGEEYNNRPKVIGITLVKNLKLHNQNKFIQKYYITNEQDINDKMIPESFYIILINLKVECTCEYYEFENWRRFLNSENKKEMYNISKTSEILLKAYKEEMRFMNLEYVQDFRYDEMLRRSREIRHIKEAREEGIKEGKKEGIDFGILEGSTRKTYEIAIKMLKANMSIKEISKITGLTIKEIKELKTNKLQIL